MYKGNLGVLAVDEQIEELKDYFTQTRPDDFLKFEHIHFGKARSMINEAKEQSLLAELNEEKEPEIEEQKIEESEIETQEKKRGRPKVK